MCPRGNSCPPERTLTKWWKWCVHARYMKVLSVTVSMFKRRMEKKLGERTEKNVLRRLVVRFWDCFAVTLGGFMLLYYLEGGRRSGGPPPEKLLVEYVQICDILDQVGRKTLPTGQSLFLTLGTGMVLKLQPIILKINEGDWMLNSWLHTFWMFWTNTETY